MEKIGAIVKQLISDLESKKGQKKKYTIIEELLNKFLTKQEFKHIRINTFKKGILYITIDSSSWMYSINLKKGQLLEEIKKSLSDIKDVRFFLGELK